MKAKLLPELVGKDAIIGRPIRLNRQELQVSGDGADVYFIGDIHYGSPQFDEKKFRGYIDFCVKNYKYVFLMGDLIEMATRHSVGAGVYEQNPQAQSQYEQMVEWLRPLAERHLILGCHIGNHEERAYKESGVNVSKALCRELNIPYLGDACWSQFRVGKEVYSIYSLHGRTGSRFDGTALLAIERISTSFFADLVAMGHVHKCVSSAVVMQKVSHNQVQEHKKFLLITGAFLRYDGGLVTNRSSRL